MPRNSVLHGYYPIGGEKIAKELVKIDHQFNSVVSPKAFAITEDVLVNDPQEDMRIAGSVNNLMLPVFRHCDVDDLKLSLFYSEGAAARIQFLSSRLHTNPSQTRNSFDKYGSDRPWGKKGIAAHIMAVHRLSSVVLNAVSYEYDGVDGAGRPSGSLRLKLDPEAEQNQEFFNAQLVCLRGIKAVTGNRTKTETASSVRIGKVDMMDTSLKQVELATSRITEELREEPIMANVGVLVMKQRS